MAGPPRKNPATRQRRNQVTVLPSAELAENPPRPPKGLLSATRKEWKRFWESDVAKLTNEVDLPAIERLFRLYDEMRRIDHELDSLAKRRKVGLADSDDVIPPSLVVGSKGNLVLNPLLRHQREVAAQVRELEDRFGLTPRARLNLGIAFGSATESMRRARQVLNAPERDGPDPRETLRAI